MPNAGATATEKFIIVIGESGVGKSTILNMLYNQDTTVECCTSPCTTGSTAASVTKASAFHINLQSRWCFVDTIGVGDPDLSEHELVGAIRSLVRFTTGGAHCVIVVMRMERVPRASRINFALLQEIFEERDIKTHGVLVLTHWDGELGTEHADLEAWLGRDETMRHVVQSFSKVVLTNNQVRGRGAYPECRQNCLAQLNEIIRAQTSVVHARPVSVYEVLLKLLNQYMGFFTNSVTIGRLKHLLGGGSAPMPTYCGECSVCLSQVELREACKLYCNHTFHQDCLREQHSCPLCRHQLTPGDWWVFE